MRKLGWIGLWIVTILETLTMGLAGLSKFMPANPWPAMFVSWGYPAWFATVIGALEIAGAVGVLIPRIAHLAAAGLFIIMTGALYTVLTNENQLGWQMGVIHMGLQTMIFVVRSGIFPRKPPEAGHLTAMPGYSQRSARIGSTPAARRAGR